MIATPAPTLFDPAPRTLDARFLEFDRAHPEVYRLFVRFAEQLLAAGHRRGSAEQLMQRIRWETAVNPERDGGWKLNDHYRARYARKLAAEDARFENWFEFRSAAHG